MLGPFLIESFPDVEKNKQSYNNKRGILLFVFNEFKFKIEIHNF